MADQALRSSVTFDEADRLFILNAAAEEIIVDEKQNLKRGSDSSFI